MILMAQDTTQNMIQSVYIQKELSKLKADYDALKASLFNGHKDREGSSHYTTEENLFMALMQANLLNGIVPQHVIDSYLHKGEWNAAS